MGRLERRQRQKDEVYESILEAAWKLVKEEGWQGLSIRKIAEAIEYSIPVIYDHFENKEAILREFTKKGFVLLNDKLTTAAGANQEPVMGLRAVASAYWNFAVTYPEYYHLMYGMGMPGCEMVNEMPEVKALTVTLGRAIEMLYPDKSISAAEGLVKMKSFWSMLHGLVSIQMMSQERTTTDITSPVLAESVNNFLAGIRFKTSPDQGRIR